LLRLADGHGYFLAAKGTAMDLDWMLLERAGWAREFRDGITIRTWCVTDAGRAALGGAVPEKPAVHP
jgi:hypothetical protein